MFINILLLTFRITHIRKEVVRVTASIPTGELLSITPENRVRPSPRLARSFLQAIWRLTATAMVITASSSDHKPAKIQLSPDIQDTNNSVITLSLAKEIAPLTGPFTGKGVTIAFIDTGVNYYSPNLGGMGGDIESWIKRRGSKYINDKVVDGYNFADHNRDPIDKNGHGTEIASIAAGRATDDAWIKEGVARDAKIVSYKVFDNKDAVSDDWVVLAIKTAVRTRLTSNRVDIINLSIGDPCKENYGGFTIWCGPDNLVSKVIDEAINKGIIVVIAAGNSGASGAGSIASPAVNTRAITVGAVGADGKVAAFSSRGPVTWNGVTVNKPDVVAPAAYCKDKWVGKQQPFIYRCLDEVTAINRGTSEAAAAVSGYAALILEAHPAWGPDEVKAELIRKAVSLGEDINTQGAGFVDSSFFQKPDTIITITTTMHHE